MSNEQATVERIEQAIRNDGRYPLDAFDFLRDGLQFTAESAHGPAREGRSRHVNGTGLCFGLRQLALDRFGGLAGYVLSGWNIVSTQDFGQMVFLMIRVGEFGKQETDRIEDFDDVYDFESAFGEYDIPLDAIEIPLDPED